MIILGPVAIAANNVIGKNNALPWYIPEDLKHFKNITTGKTVLMGRKTYDSIIKHLGKPLPNRTNVVISRNPDIQLPKEVLVYQNIETAFSELKNTDIYVIGGQNIFSLAAPLAEYMYITRLKKPYDGDVYFPTINWDEWQVVKEEDHPEFKFIEYRKQ